MDFEEAVAIVIVAFVVVVGIVVVRPIWLYITRNDCCVCGWNAGGRGWVFCGKCVESKMSE